jgi:fatty acid desaturase
MSTAIALVAVAVALRVADALYHSDTERVLRHLRVVPHDGPRERYFRTFDVVFAPLPFIWNWCEILAAVALAQWLGHAVAYAALVIFVGARFRALQEVGHTAVHFGLCRGPKWQWALSNLFFQYPCFKPDMRHRLVAHVQQHHRNANEPSDPNIVRFQALGFVPGMSEARFRIMLFHSFTPRGLAETLQLAWRGAGKNTSAAGACIRAVVVLATATVLLWLGGWHALVFGYVVPLLTIYPWFSWISLLVEHRWFADCRAARRVERECINGRPTDYHGVTGWLIKHFVLPATDHYHLAHSLYPHVRWNYIAAVDRALKATIPHYCTYRSEGLVWPSGSTPSALSELRERLTSATSADVAPWARFDRSARHDLDIESSVG